jgi:hypothetical protein
VLVRVQALAENVVHGHGFAAAHVRDGHFGFALEVGKRALQYSGGSRRSRADALE